MGLPNNLECRALAERASRGAPVNAVELVCDVRGRSVSLNVWASAVVGLGARPDGVVMMAVDVSERKALEARMQQSQRIESLGVLAGGIAHDFNNLLTGVMGNASMLQNRFQPGSREARAAADLISAGQVMARLTGQMLTYSGRSRVRIELLDISAMVHQITSLLRAAIPKNVQLKLELCGELPRIEGDASQIQQVVMNLVTNAAEAVGSAQGVIDVRTAARRAEAGELLASVTSPLRPAGEYVVLEVRDSGSGMDSHTVARIFDPFFSTKFAGRGMGLSAVLGIVRSHQGALVVESAPGAGSAFRAFFPCSAARKPGAARQSPVMRRGAGTVLVVDDEEYVIALAQSVLEEAGYEVLIASNGHQALEIYAAHFGRIDAVLLDMIMPVMGGEETLQRLAARWPDVVVIATSGYDVEEAQRRLGAHPAGFLQKPYTAGELTAKVAEVMRATA